ncbi:MAG: S8 family serine peptidase [Bdellovibrio sp.]|nr:S8 family serine peptidase [Bdellovibrio sp.]
MVLGLLLSGCSGTKTADSVMTSASSQCGGQTMENRFIVQWEDGSFSVESGKSKDEFRDSFVTQNLALIKHVDADQKIQLPNQNDLRVNATADVGALATGTLNWGPAMIQASALWSKNIKGDGIAVAVIDGMVDVTNTQLRPNILINPNEIPNNGIDDDNNGYIDDVYGIQVNAGTNDPTKNKHGSHVAGTIAADSTVGPVQGVAPRAKIIPAQFIDNDGGGSVGDGIIAMNYAATRGAKIMNMSWGGSPCIPNLQAAMNSLSNQGVLLITASGNEGENVDYTPSYPSAFNLYNQINVAASTIDDFMIYFSNFGQKSVHVAAPGVDIYSTVPGNQVESMSGTSMASPMTAGAAALLWSAFPTATAQQVKQALLKGVDVTAGHEFQVSTHGRINVNKSYTILKSMLGL